MTEQFCDVGRGITLCHERFGDPADPPILLIMGLGTQMIAWHDDFCAGLVERGFHVVRFDNRDIGRSTRLKGRPPSLRQMLTRRFSRSQYTLADMAQDTAGLIRRLGIAPAHLVGASMGGMIGQTLAARHPEVVRTLVSIMSSTGNRWKGQPHASIYRTFLRPAPREREAYADYAAELFTRIGSPGFDLDVEYFRERALRSFDRGHNPAGTGRQLGAILKSGDRTRELRDITAPTLVIHGDSDRLTNPSGGRATARAIPGAELMIVDGMGHDLPRGVWPQLLDAIAQHARGHDAADGAEEVSLPGDSVLRK